MAKPENENVESIQHFEERGETPMSKIRLIDTADRFLLEIDGKDIPHVSTYEISKSVLGYLSLKVMLSVDEIEELTVETDKPARVVTK